MDGTRILIRKSARLLELSGAGDPHAYAVDLGRNPHADKAVEGDGATPVGEFYVCAKNPRSRFYLSVALSYPNAEDADRGLRQGLISGAQHDAIVQAILSKKMPPQHTRLGGEIYIHGRAPGPVSAARDWTRGCIAVDNAAMQTIYDLVSLGTPVIIVE